MPSGGSPPAVSCATSPFLASGAPTSAPEGITATAGSGGVLWLTESDGKQMGRIVGTEPGGRTPRAGRGDLWWRQLWPSKVALPEEKQETLRLLRLGRR